MALSYISPVDTQWRNQNLTQLGRGEQRGFEVTHVNAHEYLRLV